VNDSVQLELLVKHSLDGDVFLASYNDMHPKWGIFEQSHAVIKVSKAELWNECELIGVCVCVFFTVVLLSRRAKTSVAVESS